MSSFNVSGSDPNSEAIRDAESTLRLIANLPAPRGIEDRVIARVRSAPHAGSVLNFPSLLSPADNWMRAAAAAAIAFLVVGGGWGVYLRIQQGGVAVTIPQASHSNGFSNAGAVRVPQTLQAPIVTEPSLVQPAADKAVKEPGKAEPPAKRKASSVSRSKAQKAPAKQQLSPTH